MTSVTVLFLLYSTALFSATKALMPTENLPRELVYLTESLQELLLKDASKLKKNDSTFLELGLKFKLVSKEELFFIAKAEVYKTSLAFKPPLSVKESYYLRESLVPIRERIKRIKLNSFTHWLVESIIKDVEILFESRHYSSFINERSKGALSSRATRKMQKKFNFLLPWLQSFSEEDAKLFQYSLLPLMRKILSNVSFKIGLLTAFTEQRARPTQNISFFEVQSVKLNSSGKAITVEDILDPLLGKLRNRNLPVPVDDWLNDDDDFARSLTPVKMEKLGNEYQAPEKLPTPSEDW